MPTYPPTITSPAEERGLTFAVARYNLANDTSVTNAQFLAGVVNHKLKAFIADMRNWRRGDLEQKYEDATPAVKASVNSALGYTE
jgi:hypothetical protein